LIKKGNKSHVEMKRPFFIIFALFLIFGLTGIWGAQATESFKHSRLAIHSGDVVHPFTIEIAETSWQRAQGLQYRKSMAPDHGMLFNFRKPVSVSMWMKNTYMPLDILFISEHGKIINIIHNTEPLSLSSINAVGPAKGALELLAGTVNRLNIKAGDMVLHPIF
jgi:uncharacterized membrane protein (UPF0127 family)